MFFKWINYNLNICIIETLKVIHFWPLDLNFLVL